MTRLQRWIVEHDDSWLFVVCYIGLAVVLSIWISLFWLVAVVGVHFALEWIRQSHIAARLNSPPRSPAVMPRVLWELKLDFGLILFALVIGVYMEFVFGLAGLSAAARVGARFAGWQRAMRGVLLSLDDAAQLGRAAVMRAGGGTVEEDVEPAIPAVGYGWSSRWSLGDRLSIGFGATCLVLLLLGPIVTDHSVGSMIAVMLDDLHPFPARAK